MTTFKYRVRTPENQLQSGLVDAPTSGDASEALIERGYEILILEPYAPGSVKRGLTIFNRIKAKDVIIMSRTLSVMVSAAIPVVDALKNIAYQTINPNFRMVMQDVATEVESGARLSDAFERHPKVFSGFFVNMIRSGETSGQLEEVMEYLADQQERDYDLTSRIKGAFIYPGFILSALFIVGFIMMAFVVPSMTKILEEAGASLPFTTRALIAVSGFFEHHWLMILFGIVCVVILVQVLLRTPSGRYQMDRIKIRTPIFGRLFQSIYVVRFARSFATLIRGGVDQISALEIVAGIVGNQVWKDMIYQTIREVNEGNSITTAFVRDKHVPTMMNQMIAVGEETGKLQDVLNRVADFFKRDVDNLVRNLVALIEPVIMVFLGLAVGVMVSAILLPMYNLSSAIG